MSLHAISAVPNGVMRVIGGMQGTNMEMGKEMGENIRGVALTGAHKTVGAIQSAGTKTSADFRAHKDRVLQQQQNAELGEIKRGLPGGGAGNGSGNGANGSNSV